MATLGECAFSRPNLIEKAIWKDIHERLFFFEPDAEIFIINTTNHYDRVFIDAYDGANAFHLKLWDPHSPFLKALEKHLHPQHGIVVVNLHSDSKVLDLDGFVSSVLHQVLPMGKYISVVSQAYKDVLVGKGSSRNSKGCGFAYTVSVPWVYNTSLFVCRSSGVSGGILEKDLALNALMSEAWEIEKLLNLPFSYFEYVKRGFTLVD
ncbi:hypothetical protein NMG60_11031908 [Bertholletia excelsa]